jgi:hypothetical protein
MEATGDGDDIEDEDEDDMYTDDVNQDHVQPVATGTEPETVPTVSTGGGPAVEPSAADIHPQHEHERGITDKTLHNTGVEGKAPSGGGVLAHGSTEEVHAVWVGGGFVPLVVELSSFFFSSARSLSSVFLTFSSSLSLLHFNVIPRALYSWRTPYLYNL